MPPTRSTTAVRAGRLLALALVPVALGAACGGGGGGDDAAKLLGGDDASATTAPAGDTTAAADAATTTAATASSSGGPETWCSVLDLVSDKIGNDGPGTAFSYPQLVAKMKGVEPPAEAAPYWNTAEKVLARPGFDPLTPEGFDIIDPMFRIAPVAMRQCPSTSE